MVTIEIKNNALPTARVKKGFSLRQLGEVAKVNYVTLSRIEKGKANPNPATASKICKALDAEFDELFWIREV